MKAKFDGRGMSNGEIIENIFDNRGVDFDKFINPNVDDLLPAKALKNIDKAFKIVDDALADNKSFLIWADVDVDGISSAAIMFRYLMNYTDKVGVRINEGKAHGVKEYNGTEEDVIIVVDSIDYFSYYKVMLNQGKKVIILDHHEIPNEDLYNYDLPNIALVSSANNYPNPELSGAGVVWKFCSYLDEMNLECFAENLIDLAACGLIADMVDLNVAENRYICDMGLREPINPAVKAIVGSYKFNSQAVSFSIAPLVNAANRMDENEKALGLFLTDDDAEIKATIKDLKGLKAQQDSIVKNLSISVQDQIDKQKDKNVICVITKGDNFSGLLANQIGGTYQKPVIVGKVDGDFVTGSGRGGYGISDFMKVANSTELAWCAGHPNAFGIKVEKQDYVKFVHTLNDLLADATLEQSTEADVELGVNDISCDLIEAFKRVDRISGMGFPALSVCINNVTGYDVGSMSNGKHLKLSLGDLLFIKWNFHGDFEEFDGRPISVIGTLDSGYFGRTFYRQFIIQDIKVGDAS